ncbi:MAG: glycoside hydrolase TIM-barrel-like domain-containing protein [Alphaproteobacteria bacterium]
MGALILSTVGRAVGTYLGGPVGGQIGSALGGAVGSGIGGSTRHYEGARLEDLAVQTSTYGKSIPIVFGQVRLAGNIVWSLPIKEIATTSTVSAGGGKGGAGGTSSTSTTSYSYYVTLAIAICEGEITQVDRVWADSALLDLSQGTYRIYTGTETQMPDALIESYEGVGSTPAFRGMAYVVIEDFPLADFGNRIPNFTFEVTRRVSQDDHGDQPVEEAIISLMLIPGSGEFVYDTVAEFKVTGQTAGSGLAQQGYQFPLNQQTPQGKANVLVALDQMQATFPNLAWVGIAVNWFGTTMDISTCEVWPCVEYQDRVTTTPNAWGVAGLTRATARLIGSDGGSIRYGGTPDDASLLRLITELKNRGLKVFFYPMMLMDVAGKPWRGELTGSAANVHTFFTKTHGYNAFITHYATLVAGHVDAFAIGTELKALTAITSGSGIYPAVSELVSLAGSVKTILGSSVTVTYAADWSEYHHTDGGWYNLDPLWACSSIDVIGIDAYFPLTDAVQVGYDIDAIIDGWTSGEGYDWYYTDMGRTTKASLSAPYAWKNIAWWWNNHHVNPDSTTTSWTPASKPIWFTEYGFPSVDGCANEPNVFVDATSSDSAYPRFSRARVDFMAQRVAIAGTEAQWSGSTMIPRKFLWTWDARPYPYWPDLLSVWSDGADWVTGHWVEGKLGASHVAPAVVEIVQRAGLPADALDTSQLQMLLDGFIINNRVTARAAIDQLQQAFFFSMRESGDALVALPIDATIDAMATVDDCIPFTADGQSVAYELTRQEDLVLPDRIEVQYLDRLASYDTEIAASSRGTQEVSTTGTVALSLVLSEAQARAIADTQLATAWAQRSAISLQLPMQYAALEAGDLLQLTTANAVHNIRVQQVQVGHPGIVRIKGVVDIAQTWDGYVPPVAGGDGSLIAPLPATRLELLDIPAFPGDAQDALTLRFAACGISDGWKGATILRESTGGEDAVLLSIDTPSTIGTCLTIPAAGPTERFDHVNTVEVVLLGAGELSGTSEGNMLNGANAAIVGDEIIQFATVTTLGPGHYVLGDLLRARLGTEAAMATHAIGERFVLLDATVQAQAFTPSVIGQSWTLRASTFGGSLSDGTETTATIEGNSLLPLSPCSLAAHRETSGDVTISWIRRARIDGEWRDYVDVPLMEQSEAYDVAILSGSTVVRSWQVASPEVTYTSAQQVADFGSAPSSLKIQVSQASALVGDGTAQVATVTVS